jgi:hypothetical protein
MTSRFQLIKGGEALGMGLADYVWVNSQGAICFKKKAILISKDDKGQPVPIVQRWMLSDTDCDCEQPCSCPQRTLILSPCFFLPDPTRPQPSYIILCEVRDTDDHCLPWCYRAPLRKAMRLRGPTARLVWYGFGQSYQLHDLDWDGDGNPPPHLSERRFLTAERHLGACFDAGLLIHSAWDMPGATSWEFKVGVRGFPQDVDPDPPSALVVADHLVVALYLLHKIGAEKGLVPLLEGQSLFLSTPELREPGGDHRLQSSLLMTALSGADREVRSVPHPVHGGCQCIEVTQGTFNDPYRAALHALEAVWPLDETPDSDPPAVEEEEDP